MAVFIQYQLRPPLTLATWGGGVISVGADRTVDVFAALAAGGGTIAADSTDLRLIYALDNYPPLYRVGTTGTSSPIPITGLVAATTTTPQTGDTLIWDANTAQWANGPGAAGVGGSGNAPPIHLGNSGAATSVTLTSDDNDRQLDVYVTLTANAVLTINGLNTVTDCTLRIVATQDATGGRTLAIKEAISNQTTTITNLATTANATTFIYCFTDDGVTLQVIGPSGGGSSLPPVTVAGQVLTTQADGTVAWAGAASTASPACLLVPFQSQVYTVNQGYNGGQNAITARGFEYAIFVRSDQRAVIEQRSATTHQLVGQADLSGVFGTQVADGHNSYSMAVDGNGCIHIAGNMHAVALKYCKSNAVDSVTAGFTTAAMTGLNETAVTYPFFVATPTGELRFIYRSGVSGDGDCFLNRYVPGVGTAGTWTQTGKILDGITDGESAYNCPPMFSQNGAVLGLSWIWRAQSDPTTHHDVHYMESADGGATWTNKASSPVSPFPVRTSSNTKIQTIASGSGLLAPPSLDFDSSGKPHLVFSFEDANGFTNVRHVYWDGAAWQAEFVTFDTLKMPLQVPIPPGVVDGTVGRPGIICSSTGETYAIRRTNAQGKRGTVRAVDISIPGSPVEFPIAAVDVGYQETLFFDTPSLRQGRLRLVLVPQPYAQTGAGDYGDALNWQAQWGATYTVDLASLRQLAKLGGGRPWPRVNNSASMPQGTAPSTTSTTLADVTGTPAVTLGTQWPTDGRLALARLTATLSKATSGTGTAVLVQKDNTGAVVTQLSSITVASTDGVTTKQAPYVPIQLDKLYTGGNLNVQLKSSDTAAVTLNSVTTDVALVEDASGDLIGGPSATPILIPEKSYVSAVTSASLYAHYDANKLTGLVANNAKVVFVPDRSGNRRHLTAATGFGVPTFKTAVLNSLPVIDFNGAQILQFVGFAPSSALVTVIAVVKSTVATAQKYFVQDNGATFRGPSCLYLNATTARSDAWSGASGGTTGFSDTEPVTATAFSVISSVTASGSVQTFVNGTSGGATTVTGTQVPGKGTAYMGSNVSAGALQNPLTGQIAEILVFVGGLSSAERHSVEQGLGTDYGITIV